MFPTSLLLMKSLNKTETPVFLSVVCSLFPKAIILTFTVRSNYIQRGSLSCLNNYPAGAKRLYNVALTSMQRHDVASTLKRRYKNVKCPLGNVFSRMRRTDRPVTISSFATFTRGFHETFYYFFC